jgi:hypothetical protein
MCTAQQDPRLRFTSCHCCHICCLPQSLAEVIVANTIPLRPEVAENTTKIRALSVGALLAEVSVGSEVIHQSINPLPACLPACLPDATDLSTCCQLDLEVNRNGNARSNAVVAAMCCDAMLGCNRLLPQTIRRLHTGESVSSMKESLQRGENLSIGAKL